MKTVWITGIVVGSLLGCLTYMAAENFARATPPATILVH